MTSAVSVKKSNAKFAKMTAAQKRVAIAKDVIKHLDAKRLTAATGIYVAGKSKSSPIMMPAGVDPHGIVASDMQVRDVLAPKCSVCAKGGLFIAAVDRFDKLRLGDLECPVSRSGEYTRDPSPYLIRFFSETQLDLIEYAFELGAAGWGDSIDIREAAQDFGSRHKRPADRLRAIMKNIIANRGEFKP